MAYFIHQMNAINWTTVLPTEAFSDYGLWRAAKFSNGKIIDETPTSSHGIVSFYHERDGWKWCRSEEFYSAMNSAPPTDEALALNARIQQLSAELMRVHEIAKEIRVSADQILTP